MTHRTPPRPRLLVPLALLALAACDEPAGNPGLPDGPAAVSRGPERPEGYPTRGEQRTGFITGRDGRPMEVTYEVHGGLAIWEGDIVLGRASEIPTSREALLRAVASRTGRPGGPRLGVVIDGAGFRWPGGVVPYEIDPALPDQARVTDAIAMVEQATAGVNLVPRNGEADYVRFVVSDGCSSEIGRIGGRQDINLGPDCSTGNAAHEILHALGMYHEHTRCDRDAFVEVLSDNIESGKEHNFTKQCDDASDIGAYDEGSIMHYGTHFFSSNGQPTLRSLRGRDADMGQRTALGATDTETINALYGANNVAPTAVIAALAASYPEGSSVAFDGSGSTDPDDAVLTYAWDFGDGSCSVASPPARCTAASPSHIYADNGSYTVTLVVNDGFATHSTTATATITNVVPVVSAGADASVNEGVAFARGGSFTDPGADSWTATVDYGDGSGVQPLALAGKTFALAHTYVDNGPFTITVRVTDDDGGTGTDAVTMNVVNVAPTVNAGPDATVTSGQTYALSGSFSDPGVVDHPWSWTINWGSGANTTGTTNDQSAAITASRQVCAAGTYNVVLAVTDKDGGTGSDAVALTVPYRAIGIDITPTQTPNPVNLSNRGLLPVAILSTADFDARTVDPATVLLGNETGVDARVARQNNGRYQFKVEDANRDGRMDVVAMFAVPALVANGDVTAATTQLVLRGFLADGCTNFRGVDAVRVVP